MSITGRSVARFTRSSVPGADLAAGDAAAPSSGGHDNGGPPPPLVLYDMAEPEVDLGAGWIARVDCLDGIGSPHSGQTSDGMSLTS